jgi:hypothetical protein
MNTHARTLARLLICLFAHRGSRRGGDADDGVAVTRQAEDTALGVARVPENDSAVLGAGEDPLAW